MVEDVQGLFVSYGFGFGHLDDVIDLIAQDGGCWTFDALSTYVYAKISSGFSWQQILNGLVLNGERVVGCFLVIENYGYGFFIIDVNVIDVVEFTCYIEYLLHGLSEV